jgi:hypothetical protein
VKFAPVKRRHGGFGHAIAKYAKHPAVKHNRNLEGYRASRRAKQIIAPSATVRDAISNYQAPGMHR